ncbi:MAG: hypothetical protein R6V85_15490 [Polyangia bacterium]
MAVAHLAFPLLASPRADRKDVTLEELVRDADAIATGRISRVQRSDSDAAYSYDVATIAVGEVIKGRSLLEREAGGVRRIPLCFPAESNRLRISTDVRWKKGQSGVWLLTLERGRLTAQRPGSLQPIEKLDEIRRMVEAGKVEVPPPDRVRPRLDRDPPPIEIRRAR